MKFFWRYKLDHILFWTITVLFYTYVNRSLADKAGFAHYFLDIIIRNGLIAAACYVNIYYLYPAFLKKAKFSTYTLTVLTSLLLCTALKNLHDTWLHGYIINDAYKQNFFLKLILIFQWFSFMWFLRWL